MVLAAAFGGSVDWGLRSRGRPEPPGIENRPAMTTHGHLQTERSHVLEGPQTCSDPRDPASQPDLAALSAWAPELAQTFVSLASDIALVIDGERRHPQRRAGRRRADRTGRARSGSAGRGSTPSAATPGRRSRTCLRKSTTTGIARRREVNHPLRPDASIPVAYTAIRLGVDGPVLAVGRDLRAIAAIQQRFIESQQDMERGYWQARQAESRYRCCSRSPPTRCWSSTPRRLLILEANQAAAHAVAATAEQLIGARLSCRLRAPFARRRRTNCCDSPHQRPDRRDPRAPARHADAPPASWRRRSGPRTRCACWCGCGLSTPRRRIPR